MATDVSRLQGEVSEHPETQELDVEALLAGFVRALLDESVGTEPPARQSPAGERSLA